MKHLSLLLFCSHRDHPFVKVFFCPEKQSSDHVTREKALTKAENKNSSRDSMAPDLQLKVKVSFGLEH